MIGDVDGVVRSLLEGALGKKAAVSFEPPATARASAGEKAGALLDVHLVSIEEQSDLSAVGIARVQTPEGTVVNAAPPRYIRMTYWLSAWGRDVAAEHDVLGTVVLGLVGTDHVAPELLPPGLAASGLPVRVSVAAASSLGAHTADVWASLGEPMKAGLELSLLVALDVSPGTAPGPPVLHRRLRMTPPPPPPPPAIMAPDGIPPVLITPPPPPAPAAAPAGPATPAAPAAGAAGAVPQEPAEPETPVIEELTYGPEPGAPPEVGEPVPLT
jgi:Pvc16 N-terminal domain